MPKTEILMPCSPSDCLPASDSSSGLELDAALAGQESVRLQRYRCPSRGDALRGRQGRKRGGKEGGKADRHGSPGPHRGHEGIELAALTLIDAPRPLSKRTAAAPQFEAREIVECRRLALAENLEALLGDPWVALGEIADSGERAVGIGE